MENNTQITKENNLIKFSKKAFNFNVIVNADGEFKAAQESGYKFKYNGVLLAIQKQSGTREKFIIDIETGLIIFKIKSLKELTETTVGGWIEKAIKAKENLKNTYNYKRYGSSSAHDFYKNIVKNI